MKEFEDEEAPKNIGEHCQICKYKQECGVTDFEIYMEKMKNDKNY